MRIFHDAMPASPRWWGLRRGRVTASNMDRIMTPKRRQFSAQAEPLATELAADVAHLEPTYYSESSERPASPAVDQGKKREAEARAWLKDDRGLDVMTNVVCVHDNGLWSCSPDGLIVEPTGEIRRGLELKVPFLRTHAQYLRDSTRWEPGDVPLEYMCQVHGSLIVSGHDEWLFCSYQTAVGLNQIVVEVRRNDFTAELEERLGEFTTLYDAVLRDLLGFGIADMLNLHHQYEAEHDPS